MHVSWGRLTSASASASATSTTITVSASISDGFLPLGHAVTQAVPQRDAGERK